MRLFGEMLRARRRRSDRSTMTVIGVAYFALFPIVDTVLERRLVVAA
jgi:hypothetical protein